MLLEKSKKKKYHQMNKTYKKETEVTELKNIVTKINFHHSYLT